ncbi:MAG TPA: methyltransferase domain-containing protein [Gemmatimonadales bacterium]|nr:methyltransferase domain-containing protein [Gemmatimonadales bacterium]
MTAPTDSAYRPRDYWGRRVSGDGSLSNVGQAALGPYNEYAYPFRLHALDRLTTGVPVRGKRVFDGGFGEGVYLDYWTRRGVPELAGIDFSDRAVEAGRRRYPDSDLKTGDLSRADDFTPFRRYDIVTAIDVLYHVVDDAAWSAAVGNLLSLVAPEGYFIYSDKFPRSGAWQPMPHVRRRSRATWDERLAIGGFEVVRRVPVFVLMDDPITCGSHPLLGQLARLQWRLFAKLIRMSAAHPRLQRGIAFTVALMQAPPEHLLVRLLNESPNLELVLCRRVGRH